MSSDNNTEKTYPPHELEYPISPIELSADRHLLRKIDLHLIPVLFGLYFFAFLDRINIGNAKIEGLQEELHMSGTQYNVALQIVFPLYIALEIPSNIIIRTGLRPSTWLSGIMFLWGKCIQ